MKLQRENLKGKNVLVFGSGISGMGAVKLLAEVEAQILLYDGNEKLKEENAKLLKALGKKNLSIVKNL